MNKGFILATDQAVGMNFTTIGLHHPDETRTLFAARATFTLKQRLSGLKRLEGAAVFNQLGYPNDLAKKAWVAGGKFSVFIQPVPRVDYEHNGNLNTGNAILYLKRLSFMRLERPF